MTLTTKYGGGPDFAGATKACSDVQMMDNVPIKMCSWNFPLVWGLAPQFIEPILAMAVTTESVLSAGIME